MSMNSLQKPAPGEGLRLVEMPSPEVEAGCAVLAVRTVGICGTDLHILADEYPSSPPVVLGHEFAGTVLAVGAGVDGGLVGRRVVSETYFRTCGLCRMCRAGRRNLCPDRESIGVQRNGAMASQVLVPAINLHPIDDRISERTAALAEPLSCVCQCLLVEPVLTAGDRVLVTGPGPMGALAGALARSAGCEVTIAGLPDDAERLDRCRALGLRARTTTPEADAYDVVVECSGSAGGARTCLESVRRGGRYVAIGIHGREVSVPLDLLLYKELRLTSGYASTPESWEHALRLLNNGLVLDSLVTHEFPLTDHVQAMDTVRSGAAMKVVLTPTGPLG